jgi:hypothetical protein
MRFYLKLCPFVVTFVLMVRLIDAHQESIRDAFFAIRCGMAWHYGDDQTIEQLIREGQLELRRASRAPDFDP